MIGGHYRIRWALVFVHLLLQAAVYMLLFLPIGMEIGSNAENILTLVIIFGIIGGLFIWVAVAFWLGKAFRVRRTVGMLGKDGAKRALEELLATGRTCFFPREVLFGEHFAFFFQSGSVVAYDNIRELYISRMPLFGFRIWNHDLMANTAAGKWFLLARDRVSGRKPKKTERLREYIDRLLAHNPGIIVSDP